ncbi:ATP-binding cassette domain-containing protein [Acholeplasma vituli]|uniref:ATP-binding cassette domain-containing protein n=1 Tax=Paracholeplasma vituli TaxID=69473 RepID=A0ABT2Q0I4_9MOLU|nr:ATP-binding cassette domain-containing protein [Paracholeplasma vituli]MCU0105472.1 ATP-binding cassette domain-containing protein [Paracholeplasma vituli]
MSTNETKKVLQTEVDYSKKVLEVKNLKKHFYIGAGKTKITNRAVDDVTFDIYKREVFGLVGESGCGKTTTGRTIINLYKPTDGDIYLNGRRIGAGIATQVSNIAKIKKDLKQNILNLDSRKLAISNLKKELNSKLADIAYQKRIKARDLKEQVAVVKQDIEHYHTQVFNTKNVYTLDVESIKYKFTLDKTELLDLTINKSQNEQDNELAIAKTKFNKKLEGLKESAALDKEVIQQRIADLKTEYEHEVKEIHAKFKDLIVASEAARVHKSTVKQLITDKKNQMKKDLAARKEQFEKDMNAISKPNYEAVKQKISALNLAHKVEVAALNEQAKTLKAQYKEKIVAVPKVVVNETEKAQIAEKIAMLKQTAKAEIEVQKAEIVKIKEIYKGSDSTVSAGDMQMIFQDPISSLNPRMTVKEIIGEGLTVQGISSKDEIDKKVKEVLRLVGLAPEYATRYPHEFSGGQRQRIGIARALIMNPTMIIADEPISALDVSIRAQVINLLTHLKEELDLTILFIAHDLSVVRFFCDRIAVMYAGKIVELASSEDLFKNPIHPYTKSLLSAIPQPDPDYEKGRKRTSYNPRQHDYRHDKPAMREVSKDHFVYLNQQEFDALKK